MIRTIIPFMVSIVVVLLVVGLAVRTERGQFVWSEIARRRKEVFEAPEDEDELLETGS